MAYPIAIPITAGVTSGATTAAGASSLMAFPPALLLAGITSAFLPTRGGGVSPNTRTSSGRIEEQADVTRVAQPVTQVISSQYPGVYLAARKPTSTGATPTTNPPAQPATQAKPKRKTKAAAAATPQPTPEPEKPKFNKKEFKPFYGYKKGGFWPTVGRIIRDANYINVGLPLAGNVGGFLTGFGFPFKVPLTTYLPGASMPWQEEDNSIPQMIEITLPSGKKAYINPNDTATTSTESPTVVISDPYGGVDVDSLMQAKYGL